MCEHCNGECLGMEEILSLPELQKISKEVNEEIKMEHLDDIHQNENLDINNDKILEVLDYDDIKKEIRGYELIFLSHPFADDPQVNKRRVDFIAKEIREANPEALILSPLHSFSYFDTDDMRDAIMYECYQMIERVDVCVFVQYDGMLSDGQSDEMLYAKECGKEIEIEEINQQMLDRKLKAK